MTLTRKVNQICTVLKKNELTRCFTISSLTLTIKTQSIFSDKTSFDYCYIKPVNTFQSVISSTKAL